MTFLLKLSSRYYIADTESVLKIQYYNMHRKWDNEKIALKKFALNS